MQTACSLLPRSSLILCEEWRGKNKGWSCEKTDYEAPISFHRGPSDARLPKVRGRCCFSFNFI